MVGKNLGRAVGDGGVKRRKFLLRSFRNIPEHFTGTGLIKFCLDFIVPYRVQKPQSAERGNIGGKFRDFKTDLNVALRAKVVNFIRLNFFKQLV